MRQAEIKLIAHEMKEAVRVYVARATSGMSARLQKFEENLDRRLMVLETSEDGFSAEEMTRLVMAEVSVAVGRIPPPAPGRDADELKVVDRLLASSSLSEMIRSAATQAIATLPRPKDGEPGAPGPAGRDVDLETVRALVAASVATAIAGIRVPKDGEPGAPGAPGSPGKDADPELMRATIEARVAEAVATAIAGIRVPKDGEPGAPGKDADPDAVQALVDASVARAMLAIRPPKDGEPGAPGAPGSPGKDADPEAVLRVVEPQITEFLAARLREAESSTVELIDRKLNEAIGRLVLPKGEPGEPGAPGSPGKDADPELMRATIEARVAEAVATAIAGIRVPKDGEPGAPGVPGRSVERSEVEAMVNEVVLDALARVPEPKDGKDGLDAAQIEILNGIDPAKSYPRGTWAAYEGGIVRAVRATDPIGEEGRVEVCGWAIAVGGVADVVVEQSEDLRTFSVKLLRTGGVVSVSKFTLPALIYRQIWREGEYTRGDVATLGGSQWHCNETTTDKPGTSSAWTLMVKRGRDGKDAGAPR